MKALKHIDFFSGIGGFALAAQWVGWQTVCFCEKEKMSQYWLEQNFPDIPIIDDVHNVTANMIQNLVDETDELILTAGFPCQPFSVAGQREGDKDERFLWEVLMEKIRQIKPTWFIGENVTGILSMGQSATDLQVESEEYSSKEEDMVLHRILQNLEEAGYEVQTFVIPASGIGAPHKRDRVWIVAYCDQQHQRRNARRYEKESGGKRLRQSDAMEWVSESNSLFRKNADDKSINPNSKSKRTRGLSDQSEKEGTRSSGELFGELYNATEPTPNPSKSRQGRSSRKGIPTETESSDTGESFANTNQQRSQRQGEYRGQMHSEQNQKGQINRTFDADQFKAHWYEVATQLCFVDDGLPNWMDRSERATIYKAIKYFGRAEIERKTGLDMSKVNPWRKQALEGAGNAIVPQVAYQIYLAIEEVRKQMSHD